MKNRDIVERLGTTRARIEAAVRGPSVLVVTSALATDGSSVLASALAETLVRAKHSVLLVCRDGGENWSLPLNARVAPYAVPRDLVGGTPFAFGSAGLSVIRSQEPCSLEAARAEFAAYREKYKFTIVDAPSDFEGGNTLSLASAADFVLVAFEEGRSARPADRELVQMLKSTDSKLLGVVTLERKTIRARAQQVAAYSAPPRVAGATAEEAPKRTSVLSSMIG